MAARRTVRTLQLAGAALSSGYGVMFALLAEMRDQYGISETMLGLIVAAGFFSSFAAQILLAPQADRGRARLLLLGGFIANVSGLLVMSVSSDAAGFLVGRVVTGLGVGAAYPAIRRALAVAEPDQIGRNLGGLLSYDVVGFLSGPAMAAVLAGPLGIRWPFAVAAAIAFVFLPLAFTVPMGEPSAAGPADAPRLAIGLLREPWMQAACCFGIAFYVMVGVFDALWAIRIRDLNGHDLFVTLGIIVFAAPLVVLGPRGGAFAERCGPFRAGAGGLTLAALWVSCYGLVPVPVLLIGIGVVHAIGDAFTAASVPVAISLTAPPERLAGAQGLVGAVQTLVGGVAASGAGAVYDRAGPVTTYGLATAVMLMCVAVGWSRAGLHRGVRGGSAIVAPPRPAAAAAAIG